MLLYLQLGSNLGQREIFLARARAACELALGKLIAQSSIYETAPWGVTDQDHYLNQIIVLETGLAPIICLKHCQQIETALGRLRSVKWGARTIDIDLLFQDDQIIDHPDLQLPHPFMQDRRFVLLPLCEVAEEFVHPVLEKSVRSLLSSCSDKGEVLRYLRF